MKKSAFVLLLLLLLVLPGCRTAVGIDNHSEEVTYHSDTSVGDCYLCGGGIENIIPSYWGQDNVALISLNTFEIKPIEINRYDRQDGHLIEKAAGAIYFSGGKTQDGGFSANLMLEHDRGFATGSVDLFSDEKLDADKAASFLCADCLNEILPQKLEQCFGVGVINLNTKEIRLLEENLNGFGIGDFYVDIDLKEENSISRRMDLLVFYCPIRYENEF